MIKVWPQFKVVDIFFVYLFCFVLYFVLFVLIFLWAVDTRRVKLVQLSIAVTELANRDTFTKMKSF